MFQAVLFDFDGVIADTEWLHSETFRQVLAEAGVFITDEDHDERFLGINDRSAFVKAFAEVGRELTPAEVESLAARKSAYYSRKLDEIRPYAGVPELVRALADRVPLAIASGGRVAEINAILEAQGLRKCFVAVYSADEVPRSKPAPDLFLAAFEAIREVRRRTGASLRANQCVAIEDSIHGVRAARAAGLHCIAVAHTYPRDRLGEANRIVQHISELTVDDLVGPEGGRETQCN